MDDATRHVSDVTTADFQEAVLQRSREVPVLVDFWAEWCQPCKTLSPVLEALADEYAGAFELAKVDVDQNRELSAQFGVQSIPTVVAVKDGREITRFTGALPADAIRQFLEPLLPTELDGMVDQARTALVEGDNAGAEHILRQVLDTDAGHQDAGTSLAAMLIDRGDIDEALIVLGKLVPDQDVERLQAAARLRRHGGSDIAELEATAAANPDSDEAQIALADALAASSQYEPALDILLSTVSRRGDGRDDARKAMIDIFDVLGSDHPLTMEYRRRLATELF